MNSEIKISGKKYRVWDSANQLWKRFSFWSKASDVECDDNTTVQDKIGNIKGLTTSTQITENGYIQDAKVTQEQINEVKSSLTAHKTGADHDSRYLLKSAVANNKTTSAAGYALDARQANASIAGTLAADIQNCLKSVSDGKSTVASAITAQGVSTATTATFQTMAANIATAASAKYSAGYNAGVSATKKGTAAAAQVLTGYTFTNNSGVRISGTMTNRGAVSKTFTPSGSSQSYTIPAGYHNGSGKVTCNATNIVKDTNTMSIPIYKYSASSTDYQFSTSLSNFKDMYDNIVITPGSPGATVIFTKSDESTVTKKITAATTYAISSYTKVVIKNTNDGYGTVKIKFSNN